MLTPIPKPYLLSVVFLILCKVGFSQNINPYYENLTVENGLLSNECYQVIQDRKGYYWIASDNGVVKYNGSTFKYFNTSNGLLSNTVFNFFEDQKGNVWGVTSGNELFYITPNDSIVAYRYNHIIQNYLDKKLVRKVYCNSFTIKDDEVFIGFTSGPYVSVSIAGEIKSANESSRYLVKSIGNDIVYSRNQESMGKPYLSFNNKLFEVQEGEFPGGINLMRAKKHSGGLILTSSYFDGRVIYVTASESYSLDLQRKCVSIYSEGNSIWIGTLSNGIFELVLEGDQLTIKRQLFQDYSITSMFKDRNGGYWFSTREVGVLYAPNLNSQILEKEKQADAYSTLEVNPKGIFVGDSKGKLEWFDFQLNRIDNYQFQVNMPNSHRKINGNDLFHIGFESVEARDRTLVAVKKDHIPYIDFDYNGNHYATSGFTLIEYPSLDSINGRDLLNVYRKEGTLVTSHRKGFSIIDLNKETLKAHYFQGGEVVTHVEFLPSNSALISMRSGKIVEINLLNNELTLKYHPEFPTAINEFVSTENGYLLATNEGLIALNRNFERAKCLISEQIVRIRKYAGDIIILTKNRLIKTSESIGFDINDLSLIELKKVSVDGEIRKDASFDYTSNSIEFSFESIGSIPFREIVYDCFLINDGDTTVNRSSSPSKKYQNLSPGTYTFYAQDVETMRSTKPLVFTIQAPFWMKSWFWPVIFSIILLGLTLLFWIRISRIKRKEQLERKIVELKSSSFRAQMNPHFVFNVMNIVQNVIAKKDFDNASKLLSKFSRLMRNTLNYSTISLITVQDEITFIRSYFELESLRFDCEIELEINCSETLKTVLIPSLITQPLVENAVLHGILKMKEPFGKVQVNFLEKEDQLIVEVLNTGKPIKERTSSDHTSKGLALIESRLKIAHRHNKLTYESVEDGMFVTKFTLNIKKTNENNNRR